MCKAFHALAQAQSKPQLINCIQLTDWYTRVKRQLLDFFCPCTSYPALLLWQCFTEDY